MLTIYLSLDKIMSVISIHLNLSQKTRNSITVAEGILSALNSPNIVYEKVFENIVDLSSNHTTGFSPTYNISNRPPNLQASALQLLSQFSVNLQALPENMQNRVIL